MRTPLMLATILFTCACGDPPVVIDALVPDAMQDAAVPDAAAPVVWTCEAGCAYDSPLRYQDVVEFAGDQVVLSRSSCQPPACEAIILSVAGVVTDPWPEAGDVSCVAVEEPLDVLVEYQGAPGSVGITKRWRATE